METVNIDEAKTRLSQLVDKAAAGEDVVVSRHGKPLVRITRLEESKPRVRFGVLAGRIQVPEDFDAPLPNHVVSLVEGALAARPLSSSHPMTGLREVLAEFPAGFMAQGRDERDHT